MIIASNSIVNFISILGAVVSIFGAIYSISHSKKANEYKKEAEIIKNSIKEKYINYSNSNIRFEIMNVLKELNNLKFKDFSQVKKLQIGKNFENVHSLAVKIKSDSLCTDLKIAELSDEIIEKISDLNHDNYSNNMTNIIKNFAEIARFIDLQIRS